MCRHAYCVWIRRPLSLGELSVWIRAKTVPADDNVEPVSPDGPGDRQDQDAGRPRRTSNVSRRLAGDDVKRDVSGRIIFGPDNAYLRDQSPRRFQSQRWTRRSLNVQGSRAALTQAVGRWQVWACRTHARSLFTYDHRRARRKTGRAWVVNHVLLGFIAALRCAARLLRKTR